MAHSSCSIRYLRQLPNPRKTGQGCRLRRAVICIHERRGACLCVFLENSERAQITPSAPSPSSKPFTAPGVGIPFRSCAMSRPEEFNLVSVPRHWSARAIIFHILSTFARTIIHRRAAALEIIDAFPALAPSSGISSPAAAGGEESSAGRRHLKGKGAPSWKVYPTDFPYSA